MRTRFLGAAFALVVACSACGGNPADVEELRKGQQQILDRLAALNEALQHLKAAPTAAPAKPAIDANTVYSIPLSNSPTRGPSDAKVTIVEFADYQWTVAMGIVTIVMTFVGRIVVELQRTGVTTNLWGGAVQRADVIIYFVWQAAVAVRLLRPRATPAQAAATAVPPAGHAGNA